MGIQTNQSKVGFQMGREYCILDRRDGKKLDVDQRPIPHTDQAFQQAFRKGYASEASGRSQSLDI